MQPGHHVRLAHLRQPPLGLRRQGIAGALPLRHVGTVAGTELPRQRRAGHRRPGPAGVHPDADLPRPAGKLQRQVPAQALRIHRQRLPQGQRHATTALGGDRVHTQPELVARGLLEQARIDPAPLDRLEYLPSLRLGHRHRVAQRTVDIQREARHLLVIGQRELQLALQHPRIGIVELHLDAGLAQARHHVAVQAHRAQLHRPLRPCHLQQRRRCRRARRQRRARLRHAHLASQPQHAEHADPTKCALHVTLPIR